MQPANPAPEAEPLSRNEFGRSTQSKIDDDVALRSAAADQRIAVGRRLHGLWPVADSAVDEPGLASVADPGPACPPHGHIACLGKFEEALEGRGPADV